MNSRQIRVALRGTHLTLSAVVVAFLYIPALNAEPTIHTLIQVLIVPLIALSGITMWQLPRINKWRNRAPARS